MPDHNGIVPLVCAACLRIVGVINVDALHQMHTNNELYICEKCHHRTPAYKVERILDNVTPTWWYHVSLAAAARTRHYAPIAHILDENPVRYVRATTAIHRVPASDLRRAGQEQHR